MKQILEAEAALTARRAPTMMVKLYSYEQRTPRGELICPQDARRISFRGADQLVLLLDGLLDASGAAPAALEPRSFHGKPYLFPQEDMSESVSGRAVLLTIRVFRRQYGSLQGEVTAVCGSEPKKVYFRSALELIRLIHERLDEDTRQEPVL